jgi:hypothetical protein
MFMDWKTQYNSDIIWSINWKQSQSNYQEAFLQAMIQYVVGQRKELKGPKLFFWKITNLEGPDYLILNFTLNL